MANIAISANPTTQQFTITLDQWEWTKLQIKENGAWVNVPKQSGGVQFQYTGTGPVQFKAVANHNIVIVNGPTTLYMTGPDKKSTYIATISYGDVNSEIHLHGVLIVLDEYLPIDLPGPLFFSQGRMTGEFYVDVAS
ncbi:hypothetical protein [Mucilaginibacter psychrotolerans]|uniref:Uncharacterized protein n=1 Tax=Mucilaginibacter psychrotolerans TaxID=1524096 RepID=A0A4Y8SFR2_9SPHI|nr:hypothetical protein [Mucilaginibacter psychrotolerans]TFF37485.1 hypothetical protein E2R66_11810 [Mucilaginibacter psychrotolerans]